MSHDLHYKWVLWFTHRQAGAKIVSLTDYNSEIKKVATISSVEDFWGIYNRLKRPSELVNISDYHFFKMGIRPLWEDNLNGGKWIIRLKKNIVSRYWEELVSLLIVDGNNWRSV